MQGQNLSTAEELKGPELILWRNRKSDQLVQTGRNPLTCKAMWVCTSWKFCSYLSFCTAWKLFKIILFLKWKCLLKWQEKYLICRISEWINKHMTKQCHGMETTLGNGRVISKDDYLWLIDSACKSGRWLCCDSRGREGRGRERSRWRECFWVCSLLKKRKVGQLGTRTLITITPSDKSICYAVKFDAHTANWTPCKGRCSFLAGLSELTTSFCFKHASYACRKCC